MLRDTPETFGTPSRLLHWLGALVIAAAWTVGTIMSALPRGPSKAAGLDLHFVLGSLVGVARTTERRWLVRVGVATRPKAFAALPNALVSPRPTPGSTTACWKTACASI